MRQARTVRLIAGIAAATMVLAACSSNSNSGSGGNTTTPQSSANSGTPTSSESSASGSGTASGSATGGASSSASGSATGAASGSGTASSGAPASSSPYAPITGDAASVKLGMAYDGPKGDMSFTDSASAGVAQAKAQGINLVAELYATQGEPDSAKSDRLSQLVDQGSNVVIAVGFDYAAAMATVAAANPNVKFGIVDDNTQCTTEANGGVKGGPIKNVTCLNFAAEQSSFLVGVAAAMKTKAKHVAFIGGVDVPLLQTFQAGFDAGVKQVDPSIKIDDKYISEPPDFTGFNAPDKGQTIAKGLYDGGADIIYAAAGGSGTGVFKAAQATKNRAIGVDSDQYNLPGLADVKDVIMTSAVKNVNIAVYDFVASVAAGKPLTGSQYFDLKDGGVAISFSGGFIDDIRSDIEGYQAKIISGEIKVPTTITK